MAHGHDFSTAQSTATLTAFIDIFADGERLAPTATARIEVRPSAFGFILVAVRDGSEHVLPMATAEALVGERVMKALRGRVGE
jgi:hypothetical protein